MSTSKEFTARGEHGAFGIIQQLKERQEKESKKTRARSLATIIMIDHGVHAFGRWIVPLEFKLTPVISLNIDLESNDEVDDPQEIRNFQLRFGFKQANMWNVVDKIGRGSSDISKDGVKNFSGEEADVVELRQIVNCLEFLQTQKQPQKEAQTASSAVQPAQL